MYGNKNQILSKLLEEVNAFGDALCHLSTVLSWLALEYCNKLVTSCFWRRLGNSSTAGFQYRSNRGWTTDSTPAFANIWDWRRLRAHYHRGQMHWDKNEREMVLVRMHHNQTRSYSFSIATDYLIKFSSSTGIDDEAELIPLQVLSRFNAALNLPTRHTVQTPSLALYVPYGHGLITL